MELSGKKILVTGGAGFLGSVVVRKLRERGVPESGIRIPLEGKSDIRDRNVCEEVVRGCDVVIHLAAKVGGIGFNREHPATLVYDNMVMGAEMVEASRKAGVGKVVLIGTVCAYPKFTPVPFQEDDIWNGYPEETNAPYGLAKKMMLVLAQSYRKQYGMNAIFLLPVNLYGPGDNFNPESSHVIPALIRKFVEARRSGAPSVEAWGTGAATREFLYVEDAAEGIVLAAEKYDGPEPVNIGAGMEISIQDLTGMIAHLSGYKGRVEWDTSKPDGQPRRRLDTTRAEKMFGFRARVPFEEGVRRTIEWYERTLDARGDRGA